MHLADTTSSSLASTLQPQQPLISTPLNTSNMLCPVFTVYRLSPFLLGLEAVKDSSGLFIICSLSYWYIPMYSRPVPKHSRFSINMH